MIPDLIVSLRADLVVLLDAYDKAKRRFRQTTELLRCDALTQPASGRNAVERTHAIADCDWYQRDIQTLSAAVTALCLSEEVRRG